MHAALGIDCRADRDARSGLVRGSAQPFCASLVGRNRVDGTPCAGWQAPQPAPGLDHELDWLLPVNRDGFAIAAGYLGLFSLIPNPITSVAAIICGIAALSSIKRTGKLGRGRAWVGLIIGGLSLGVFLLAVIGANASSH
jgi:hypothetical protein